MVLFDVTGKVHCFVISLLGIFEALNHQPNMNVVPYSGIHILILFSKSWHYKIIWRQKQFCKCISLFIVICVWKKNISLWRIKHISSKLKITISSNVSDRADMTGTVGYILFSDIKIADHNSRQDHIRYWQKVVFEIYCVGLISILHVAFLQERQLCHVS